jgi:23S rRNA pseudouridine1911/1915/1917 synthase
VTRSADDVVGHDDGISDDGFVDSHDDDVIEHGDDAGGDDAGAVHRFVVDFAQRGERLDVLLGSCVASMSRSRAAALIDQGRVTLDGRAVTRASQRVRGGEVVVVVVPPPAPAALLPEDLPLSIVFDDADFCVVDKPAGLVVHPAPGHERGTLANALLFRFPGLSVGGARRPGIVHRLDKDTSGLIVVAKNDDAQRALARQFHDRAVDKRYVAVCLGVPGDVGRPFDVVTGHARATGDRRRFTSRLPVPPDDSGRGGVRRAASRFTVRAEHSGVAVVDVELLTGRTHQIRVHLADRGHPLVQDTLYGGAHAERRLKAGPVREAVTSLGRQALHAAALSLTHPRTGAPLSFVCPLPPDLAALVAAVVRA